MFRLWAKIFKDNHLMKDTVICDDSLDKSRTKKPASALRNSTNAINKIYSGYKGTINGELDGAKCGIKYGEIICIPGGSRVNVKYTGTMELQQSPLSDDDLQNPVTHCSSKISEYKKNIGFWLFLVFFILF